MTPGILIVSLLFLAISFIVSMVLKSKFTKYSKVPLSNGMSGREIAEMSSVVLVTRSSCTGGCLELPAKLWLQPAFDRQQPDLTDAWFDEETGLQRPVSRGCHGVVGLDPVRLGGAGARPEDDLTAAPVQQSHRSEETSTTLLLVEERSNEDQGQAHCIDCPIDSCICVRFRCSRPESHFNFILASAERASR